MFPSYHSLPLTHSPVFPAISRRTVATIMQQNKKYTTLALLSACFGHLSDKKSL
jgi:hypothetical protein